MLNMRSEDLTTRARIRDAAIRCFGRDGFRAGVRVVAEEAGVSPGLVLHHFGSKDGLREACDAHVLAVIREHKREAVGGAGVQTLLTSLASLDRFAPLVAYVLRSIQEGGALARALVDHMVEDTAAYMAEGVAAGTLRPSRDEAARARYLTYVGIGTLMVDLTLDPVYRHLVLYAPRRRCYFAVEPVTNVNDGFTLHERGVPGTGVFVLEPGEERTGTFRLGVRT